MLEAVNERPPSSSSSGGGSGEGKNGASAPLSLPYRFGRYRLTQLLALGGMAQIYLAKSFGAEGFVKQLVIKRLDPRLANEPFFTDLFINEAKLLVTLSHGNIVPVFDFGRVEGSDLFIAMEHVDGVSLRTLLATLQAKRRKLDPQLAAYITAEICKGLHYAHRKTDARGRVAGIVHRDIKPTNILLSMEGEVKIVDFGVAKLSGRLESRGRLAGTLAYMSPEQANRTTKIDRRTDIFSTGLVLYEMLLGRRAYQAVAPRDMLEEARRAELPPLPDDVPRELARVAELATQREISERYASAYEMEQAVSEYLLLARAATAILDSQSPNFKLSALLKELGLGRDDASDAEASLASSAELDAPTPSAVALGGGHVAATETDDAPSLGAGLPDLDKPPDLEMMRGAAETFQSEFFTRVLQEELEPTNKALKWAVIAAAVGVLLLGVTLLVTKARTQRADAGGGSATRIAGGGGSGSGAPG
ncbi:MAG: serine/threonine protein kinase, partial [Myxococcales bacterium]|nr:serine/threonine protein kinase [Myxococcales bacterium]